MSGAVALQGVATGNLAQPLTFTFQPTAAGRSYAQAVTPNSDGTFMVSGIPAGTYNLFVKGSKWLQKRVSVDTSGGSATGVSVSLLGGDVNGDNRVDGADVSAVLAAYRATPSDPNWNAACDLTCDGRVDGADVSLGTANYRQVGDAPTAPTLTGVTSGVGNGCAVLAWTPSATATGYNVYRSTTSGSGYTQVAANQTNPYYVDLSVTNGTPYYYLVTSLAGGTESFDSTQLTATPNSTGGTLVAVTTPGTVMPGTTTTTVGGTVYTTTLSNNGGNFIVQVSFNFAGSATAPTNFSATGRNSEVVLQWDASPGATAYNIYRDGNRIATNYTGPSLGDDLGNNDVPYFVYTDTKVNNLTIYTYWVTAVNSTAEGVSTPEMDGEPSGSFGWVQRHRIYTTGAVYGSSDYDWTGLQKTELRPNGQSTTLPNQFYFGSDNGYEDSLPRGGVNGETFSGPSTYTWEWVPPLNPKGLHNDPNKPASDASQPFPAPPLFAIGSTLTNIYADPDPDGTGHPNADFNATGYVKDGLTAANPILQPQLSVTSSGPPAGSPTDDFIPRHGILTAVQKAPTQQQPLAAILTDATINPYLQIQVNNAGEGYGQLDLTETAYPLLLSLPNPMVRPDLGDQNGIGNQFVYSNDETALLQVPASISTGGTVGDPFAGDPSSDDITWLINGQSPRVTWKFDAMTAGSPATVNPHPLLYGGTSPNYTDTLHVDFYGNLLPATYNGNPNNPVLDFYGLPDSTYGLGNHTITLGVQGNPPGNNYINSQTAYIQTFFPGMVSNYPDAASDADQLGYAIKNWYYYYNQILPATGSVDPAHPVYNAHYVPGVGPSLASDAGTDALSCPITIYDDAYVTADKTVGFRVYDFDPVADPILHTRLIRYIGMLHLNSLLYYIAAVRHEQGHVDTFVTGDGSGAGNIYTSDKGPYDAQNNPNTSTDGDNISDGWEYTHHMDPRVSDTAKGLESYGKNDLKEVRNIPDEQILADIPAVGAVFDHINQWNLDWADGGLQYHNSAQPFINDPYPTDPTHQPIYPDAKLIGTSPQYPATFYLVFDAETDGKTFKKGQPYKIRSLGDLKAEYPDVLTDLQQLNPPPPNQ